MKSKSYFRNLFFSTLLILSALQINAATFSVSSSFNNDSMKAIFGRTTTDGGVPSEPTRFANAAYDIAYVNITNNGSSTLTFSDFSMSIDRPNQGLTAAGTATQTFGVSLSGENNTNFFNRANRIQVNGSQYVNPTFPNAPQIVDEFANGGFGNNILSGDGANTSSFTLAAGETRQILIYTTSNITGFPEGQRTLENYTNRFLNNPWKLSMNITGATNPDLSIVNAGGVNNSSSVVLIPEPTTALLFVLGTLAFFSRRVRLI